MKQPRENVMNSPLPLLLALLAAAVGIVWLLASRPSAHQIECRAILAEDAVGKRDTITKLHGELDPEAIAGIIEACRSVRY